MSRLTSEARRGNWPEDKSKDRVIMTLMDAAQKQAHGEDQDTSLTAVEKAPVGLYRQSSDGKPDLKVVREIETNRRFFHRR
ncbi:MAG: hypothetical protein AAFY04_08650 [Pseudomonadota bacterium]